VNNDGEAIASPFVVCHPRLRSLSSEGEPKGVEAGTGPCLEEIFTNVVTPRRIKLYGGPLALILRHIYLTTHAPFARTPRSIASFIMENGDDQVAGFANCNDRGGMHLLGRSGSSAGFSWRPPFSWIRLHVGDGRQGSGVCLRPAIGAERDGGSRG
jgi:hypothetical protein